MKSWPGHFYMKGRRWCISQYYFAKQLFYTSHTVYATLKLAFQTRVFERVSGYFKPHCKSKLRWLFNQFLREDERTLKLKNKILRLFLLLHCFCIEERNTDIQIKKYHLCDKHNILELIQITKKGSNKIHCIRNRIAFSVRVWASDMSHDRAAK